MARVSQQCGRVEFHHGRFTLRYRIRDNQAPNGWKKRRAVLSADNLEDAQTEARKRLTDVNVENRLRDVRQYTPVGPRAGHVYVIRVEGQSQYKIGATHRSVERRLRDLQTSSPYRLELIHARAMSDTMRAERELHKRFENRKIRGEWFHLTPDELRDLVADLDVISHVQKGEVTELEERIL